MTNLVSKFQDFDRFCTHKHFNFELLKKNDDYMYFKYLLFIVKTTNKEPCINNCQGFLLPNKNKIINKPIKKFKFSNIYK